LSESKIPPPPCVTAGDNTSMGQQLESLKASIQDVLLHCGDITNNIALARATASGSLEDIEKAEEAISRCDMLIIY